MKSIANICRDPNTRRMPFRLFGKKNGLTKSVKPFCV